MKRTYNGDPVDATVQYITERPVQPGGDPEGETVYVTDPDPEGECQTVDVVMPDEVRAAGSQDATDEPPRSPARESVDVPTADDTEQSTLGEWSG